MGGSGEARTAARGLALTYVAIAAMWILISDTAFELLGWPLGVWGNLAKGLLFVGVTGAVLYRVTCAMYQRHEALSAELVRQEQMQAAMFNRSPEPMWVYDSETLMLLEVNDTMVQRYGKSRRELLTMRTIDLGPSQGTDRMVHRRVADGDSPQPQLWLHFGAHGEHRWVEVMCHQVDWNGRSAHLALSRDITAQKRAEDQLRSSERRLAGVLYSMQEMAFSIDLPSGMITYLNNVAEEVLGRDPAAELPTVDDFNGIIVTDDWERYHLAMRQVVTEGWAEVEFRIHLPDETTRALQCRVRGVVGPSGRVEQVDGVAIDLTNREELVELVEHQRLFDMVTGLPNRIAFLTTVGSALAGGSSDSAPPFVALFDIDRFTAINQSAGHMAGDAVLVSIGERLLASLEPGMVAGRVGSDEFAVFCPSGVAMPSDLVDLLQGTVDDAFIVDGYEFFLRISVGIAELGEDESAERLLNDAHLAMEAAKSRTLGVEYFHPAYRSTMAHQVRIEGELRHALSQGELQAVYQPQISLATDRVVGVEALVRWNHPERGWLAAGDFILAAEKSSLIVEIGEVVLRQSCALAAAWAERYGDERPRVWINLSRRELDDPDLVGRILACLAEHHLDPSAIGVEVTETAFVADAASAVAALRTLSSAGVDVALDDFGTGWSSLQVLKSFPISLVKIDRSFITNIGISSEDTQITQAVIGMAKGMSLLTLAEGVETGDQLAHLRRLGCDQVQGYLLGRPSPADKIAEILDAGGKPTVFVR